jgi:hypothetical protein
MERLRLKRGGGARQDQRERPDVESGQDKLDASESLLMDIVAQHTTDAVLELWEGCSVFF